MKRAIIILLVFWSANVSFAQSIVFNKTYSGQTPGLRNIIIQEDGYVGLGFDVNSSKIRIYIIKTDFYGDTLWTKTYGDSYYSYYHGTRNSLQKNYDECYTLAGSRNDDTKNACMLMKFDQNFDTLWTKLYFDNPDFTVFYNHIQTSDGGFALVGCTTEGDADGDVLLVKTDSEGNMQWYKKHGTSGYDSGFCIIETTDNGFLVGGGTMHGSGDNYIIKTDEFGELQWSTHYGNPDCTDGGITNIIKTQDLGYLFTASHTLYEEGDDGYLKYSRAGLKKIDSDYNDEWYKLYGNITYQTSFGSVVETSEGDLALTLFEDYPSRSKLLFLNSQGDSLKKVGYEADGSFDEQWLSSLKQTDDKGFIMAGVAYGPQVMWLIKTDSCGCVTEDCECWDNPVQQFNFQNEIQIYPNPSNSNFTIISFLPNYINAELRITDINGHLKEIVKVTEKTTVIPTKEWIPGTYICNLFVDGKLVKVEKLILLP